MTFDELGLAEPLLRAVRDQGYTNIHNMLGGINAWQQAGYTVEK